jgi:hypothetical protein
MVRRTRRGKSGCERVHIVSTISAVTGPDRVGNRPRPPDWGLTESWVEADLDRGIDRHDSAKPVQIVSEPALVFCFDAFSLENAMVCERRIRHSRGQSMRLSTRLTIALVALVIMPGRLKGRQLAAEMAQRRPGLNVLFTSGYIENAIIHHGRLDSGVLLLAKPYRKLDLARMVRIALTDAGVLADNSPPAC